MFYLWFAKHIQIRGLSGLRHYLAYGCHGPNVAGSSTVIALPANLTSDSNIDIMPWKRFLHYRPNLRRLHWRPVNSLTNEPVMGFYVFFVVSSNKLLSKLSSSFPWLTIPPTIMWRQCNELMLVCLFAHIARRAIFNYTVTFHKELCCVLNTSGCFGICDFHHYHVYDTSCYIQNNKSTPFEMFSSLWNWYELFIHGFLIINCLRNWW